MRKIFTALLICAITISLFGCEKFPEEITEVTTATETTESEVTTVPESEVGKKTYIHCRGFSENGLAAVFNHDEKWGYVDESGNEVIPCRYDMADNFIDGFARVDKNGKCGFINSNGEIIVPLEYSFAASYFSEGLVYVKKDGKWGYADTDGKMVIPCKFEEARMFSQGMAAVKKNGKWGYIDKNGELIINYQYDNALNFDKSGEEEFAVGLKEKGNEFSYYYIIDKTGKVLAEGEACNGRVNNVGCGIIEVTKSWDNGNFYNSMLEYIDMKGNLLITARYYSRYFVDGVCPVYDEKTGILKVIDTTGKVLFERENCGGTQTCFSEGLLAAYLIDENGEYYTVYFDKDGNEVLTLSGDGGCHSFNDGLAIITQGNYNCGYMDKNGEIIIKPKYNLCYPFYYGYAGVKNDENDCSIINKNGEEIVHFEFDFRDYYEWYEMDYWQERRK